MAQQLFTHPAAFHADLGKLDEPGRDLIGLLTRQDIHRSVPALAAAIHRYIDVWNTDGQPFSRDKDANDIMIRQP